MKKILKFALDNFDTLIAIAVSLFAAIFGVFGGNQVALLAGIATTLGLLSYGFIRDRSARENLSGNIKRLEATVETISKEKIGANLFFTNRNSSPSVRVLLKNGTESLDIMGSTLISISTICKDILNDMKEKGGTVRVIVANPENTALLELIARRIKTLGNVETARNHINTTLSDLVPLIGSTKNGGSLQIKVTDYDPTFSFIGIDTQKATGKIQVEFFLNEVGNEHNPIFFLNSGKDHDWFLEFKNQFDVLWDRSTNVSKPKSK